MEIGSFFDKTRSISKLVFFIPFTLALFLFAFLFSPFLTANYVQGEGTVTKVEVNVTYDAEHVATTNYDTYFTYTVDGKDYETYLSLSEQKAVGSKLTFYYDPKDPNKTSYGVNNGWLWIVFIVAGCVSAGFTVYFAIKDAKRNKKTDELRAQRAAVAQEEAAKAGTGESIPEGEQREYYFRFDGHSLKPGYLIEDKFRTPLYEGKMLKNNPLMAKEYEFINHRTNRTDVHKVSHTLTSGSGSEFSTRSTFKFDGVDVWDYLHDKGVLIDTGMGDKFGQATYDITLNGRTLAKTVMTSDRVHEEDEEAHKVNIINKMYYRIWTSAEDLELIFITLFALAETNQLIYS